MPWPEDALSDDEEIISSFRPHWKLLFIPLVWFLGLAIAMILVAWRLDWGRWVLLGILLVLVLWFVVKPLVDWWWTRYVLTTERLVTRTGLIAKKGIEIPLENITNVNFSQTAFERILGAGDLLVESAGSTGQSKFGDIPHPDDFQSLLYKVREQRSIALTGSQPTRAPDPTEAIRNLARLKDDGLISEAEYEEKRKQILDEM